MTAIKVGVSSWSDSSLTQDGSWYPRRTMKAAERIGYYCGRFPLVEMETAYRFPPTVTVAQQWADRTPDGFTFDVPAWALLTEQPAFPPSLWADLGEEIREDRRDRRRLYATHLSSDALDECRRRFVHALGPLHRSGRLGTVILRYPRWFGPRDSSRATLRDARHWLGNLPASIEFECPDWASGDSCEETFALLEDLGFGFVCVDAAEGDPRGLNDTAATTSEIAVIRLLGRRRRDGTEPWSPDARSYRYGAEELQQLGETVRRLEEGADEVHVLVSTCWRDDAVRNAEALQEALNLPLPALR